MVAVSRPSFDGGCQRLCWGDEVKRTSARRLKIFVQRVMGCDNGRNIRIIETVFNFGPWQTIGVTPVR